MLTMPGGRWEGRQLVLAVVVSLMTCVGDVRCFDTLVEGEKSSMMMLMLIIMGCVFFFVCLALCCKQCAQDPTPEDITTPHDAPTSRSASGSLDGASTTALPQSCSNDNTAEAAIAKPETPPPSYESVMMQGMGGTLYVPRPAGSGLLADTGSSGVTHHQHHSPPSARYEFPEDFC